MFTNQRRQELNQQLSSSHVNAGIDSITIGVVVDTNDPQQMGRVRAVCQRWGDTFDMPVAHLQWAVYASPFGGRVDVGTRGPADDAASTTAYGMWAIPKVGATVLVMCIDSDPSQRVWLGCLYDQFTPHTLPHGRFMYDDHPNIDSSIVPAGPYDTTEAKLSPLWQNIRRAFGNKPHPNFEWQTRAADYTAANVPVDIIAEGGVYSTVPDDADVKKDDWTSRQGYQTNRQAPDFLAEDTTPRNLDSMVYSITSPGFHSMSMDDRMENCRMRFRTTAGHQIILDDTNERIYISTATGDNWIELDQNGNIDIFSNNKINIRSKKTINMTSDEDIRMFANKGIHLCSPEDIHIQSQKSIHVKAGENLRLQSDQSTFVTAIQEMHVKAGQNVNLTSGLNVDVLASGNIHMTATTIHHNGPQATEATSSEPVKAKWTSRVPAHEPFARTMTKDDYTHEPEFPYDDKRVNRIERGVQYTRGLYWRR